LRILKTLIKIGIFGGGRRIRTFEGRSQRVYSPPHLTALVSLQNFNKLYNIFYID
jgi:hypothetical protein